MAIVAHIGQDRPAGRGEDDGRWPGLRVVTPELAARVRLPLTSRFNNRTLADHVRRNPGVALIGEDGTQYAIAGPWRRRADIAELLELSRGELRPRMVDALSESVTDRGVRLVVLDYGLHAFDPAFFRQAGFQLIERIVELERPDLPLPPRRPSALGVRRYRLDDREQVLELERESFPWLWWNSPDEWDAYLLSRGVEVLVGCLGQRIVGYAGFVVYHHDGHLDRLAVREADQGRGYGRVLLAEALARMRERGARRVALTTQEDNTRSQALYLAQGFQRSRWTYEIHGRWLARDGSVGH